MNRTLKFVAGIIVLALLVFPGMNAQEVITPVFGNAQASLHHQESVSVKKSASSTLLELPVFDDFSSYDAVPDTGIWIDAHAFINNNYCVNPVSNGVATLDVLRFDGSLYPSAVTSTFVADHLTSHPVQLEYPASDSIYFSFLYQPGGLGDIPETADSLLVDFFDSGLDEWINVWGIPGAALHPFRHVLIPVAEERFLNSGFRFRFRNLASMPVNPDYLDKRSNVDHWNVDYVRLDRNRFVADTVLRDVAFHSGLNSILKDLTSLPWSHFEQAYTTILDPFVVAEYRNNDTITRNVTRALTIYDILHDETYSSGIPTAQDLTALEDTSVQFGYFYDFDFHQNDSAILRFSASLRTDEFDPKVNDTISYDQVFKDFYAYDDGTAEAGYGLRGQGTRNGSVAMKYFSYVPDLLGGVDLYFNQVLDSFNMDLYFRLVVWADSEGSPGLVIHEDENDQTPEYTPGNPGFKRYYFSSPVPVDGPFYIGWRQYNEYMLNVGLDLNNRPVPSVMYYNFQGFWQSSMAPGVMLFRPFLYDETTGENYKHPGTGALHIFPNPAKGLIRIQIPGKTEMAGIHLEIFDSSGRLADSSTLYSNNMDVSFLPTGIYFIRAYDGSTLYHSKLLINH